MTHTQNTTTALCKVSTLLLIFLLSFPGMAAIDSLPQIDQKLKSVDGKMLTLSDVKTKKGLLVVFSCNHCPYVKKWQDRMVEAANSAVSQGLGVIFINSNDPKAHSEDSYENMVKLAKTKGYKFPYAVDSTSDYARKFGAQKTPEAYLFNAKGKLVYHGAIDDSLNPEKVEQRYLKHAVNQLLSGKPLKNAKTKSLGCSIKFRENQG